MLPHCKLGIKSNTKKFNVIYQLNRCANDVDRMMLDYCMRVFAVPCPAE